MTQKNAIAEKAEVIIDGEEIPGLIRVGNYDAEYKTTVAPGMTKEYTISSGTKIIPPIELEYLNERSTNTRKFFLDFFNNKEKKEINLIRTDGDGVEYMNELFTNCECIKVGKPEANAETPGTSKYVVTIAPDDIKELEAA